MLPALFKQHYSGSQTRFLSAAEAGALAPPPPHPVQHGHLALLAAPAQHPVGSFLISRLILACRRACVVVQQRMQVLASL